ncbi:hypothetical protein T02_14991 [Trichinella nativa]|uniref:Uncharacterized protein n=1 Tax=Trichinella nativa TaxID=6335 RepID=A0A0V1L9E4_9BILA|nr:hypothetical protein T02_14991 [Trichinella nativa]
MDVNCKNTTCVKIHLINQYLFDLRSTDEASGNVVERCFSVLYRFATTEAQLCILIFLMVTSIEKKDVNNEEKKKFKRSDMKQNADGTK